MAPNATIYRAELQLRDLNRHYCATRSLTLAQHPSEMPQRQLMDERASVARAPRVRMASAG